MIIELIQIPKHGMLATRRPEINSEHESKRVNSSNLGFLFFLSSSLFRRVVGFICLEVDVGSVLQRDWLFLLNQDRLFHSMSSESSRELSPEATEELREVIWDHLYQRGRQTVADLADQMQLSVETVTVLVDHDWFAKQDDSVAIA